jgi:hypothetical protein
VGFLVRLAFNFHDIVAFRVETDDLQAAAFFRAEYGLYLSESLPSRLPVVQLHFRRGAVRRAPADWVRHTHKVLARWAYRGEPGDEQVVIEATGNRWAIPMVHHMLVHPSLRYLAARHGVLMLHAGAVAVKGHSVPLSGHGGVGKTTTVSALLVHGGRDVALHADDYAFVTPEGVTFSYLTRSHLYWPLLSWVPELRQRLRMAERIRLWFLGNLRRWSRDRIKWPVRMEQERLWPGRAHMRRATLSALVWLARAEGTRAALQRFSPTADDITALLEMNFYEARHFLALLQAQDETYAPQIEVWRARERELLQTLVTHVPSYRLTIPREGKDTSFLPDLLQQVGE